MQFSAFYLIEARPELSERVPILSDPVLERHLLEPEMISKLEGGRSRWTKEDHTLTIKLLFLAQIKEYTPLSSDAVFERLFGSHRLSTSLFDRWWTIRRFEVNESAEGLYSELKRFRHLVDLTDNGARKRMAGLGVNTD